MLGCPPTVVRFGRCIGAEALLRWRHPQRGLIYPGLFIPIAEQTGLILPMTEWLLEQVIQDQATLAPRFPELYTTMNLFPTQLNTGDLERLLEILRRVKDGFQPTLVFEITENTLVEDHGQMVQDAIARLKLWDIRYLREREVRYGQGWLFSRALPLEEFDRFLQAQEK